MEHKIIWKGERTTPLTSKNKVVMQIDGSEFWGNLPLYLDEVNHSPDGFEWGYYGSGPTQLSYAILRSYFVLGENLLAEDAIRRAQNLSFRFKEDFVSKWHGSEWEITSEQISFWLSTEKETENTGWV